MILGELLYRDCPWCGFRNVAMNLQWIGGVATAHNRPRYWALVSCPRCGGCVLLNVFLALGEDQLHATAQIESVEVFPRGEELNSQISHLPPEIEQYYRDALRVLDAGVPDAAAVQLRRTLEGAAAQSGVSERTLVRSIEKLVEEGLITKSFGEAVHHVRKIGNLGAHYSDERLDEAEVRRALRFTEQMLRNLFEVPGELRQIEEGSAPPPASDPPDGNGDGNDGSAE